MKIKQAIIVNLKANMSLGRLVAQVAHASELAMREVNPELVSENPEEFHPITKTVLKGWGNEHLLELHRKAMADGLATAIMEEEGFITACAIGPAPKKNVDAITHHMLLL